MQEDATTKLPDTNTGNSPKTLGDHLQALAGAAAIVGFTLLLIEILLRVLDPWGMSYFIDLAYMGNELFTPDEQRGYSMPDGQHEFSYWTSTIENGTRIIPNTNPDVACKIVILGDSVAHGYGVDDEDVWINLIAAELPNVYLINTGITRYNSTNVLKNLKAYPDGDAYLYLIVENDWLPEIQPEDVIFTRGDTYTLHIMRYVHYLLRTNPGFQAKIDTSTGQALDSNDPNVMRFLGELEEIINDDRVTIAAFNGYRLTHNIVEAGFDVLLLDYPLQTISFVDIHLNAQGNAELAALLLPTIRQMRDEFCEP